MTGRTRSVRFRELLRGNALCEMGPAATSWAGGSSMQCRLRTLVLGLAAFAASTVIAADHPVAGDTLLLKDPVGKPERRTVNFKANHDPAIDPSQVGDPRTLGAT